MMNKQEKNPLLLEGERIDDLQCKGYKIIQHTNRFCFGIDAVLLSSYANIKKGDAVLDLGTGTGVIPILLKAKTEGEHFYGLEIQEESANMARRSVELNQLEKEISIVIGDIKKASEIFGANCFQVVTVNPPYMTEHHGLKNQFDEKTIARHEVLCSLEDVIRESSKVLKGKGRFYMVHRPFRLAEIIELLCSYQLEPKRMRLVYPYINREANMVLIEGLKGGKSRIRVEKPLIVYERPNVYTQEIKEIYYCNAKA